VRNHRRGPLAASQAPFPPLQTKYTDRTRASALDCAFYDPDRVLQNPVALERDLASDASLRVNVMVRPR